MASITRTVRVDNMPRLRRTIDEIKRRKIKIGIFGSEDSEILMIASVNEFGTDIRVTPKMRAYLHSQGLHLKSTTSEIHIPERSFIRKTFNEKKNKIDTFIRQNLNEVITFRISTQTFFDRVGTYLVGLTQETLTEVNSPANHPFTLQKKAPKSNPLINTGRLRQSITYKVE
ncbi:hypothetical protein [Clostridium brassicae]|uniref:Uncharacterized protein n=1 Tax=Clostridium brassicae TaxID=2999072 RepID=A0ABT4D6G1_9CLOT|nr:hypothetical protein [Clostridium brassicae]MCY6957884.1 hypothetical protein [Clostridium brassicae]